MKRISCYLMIAALLFSSCAMAQYSCLTNLNCIDTTKPLDTDPVSQGASAIRQLKAVFLGAFTNLFNLDNSYKTNVIPFYALNISTIIITSNNIAPGSIIAANLNSNAVNQNNIDPSSGILFIQAIRAPDAQITNTTLLTSLFTPLQGPTNVALNNASQQSWVDVDILFNNATGSSVTYSNISLLTNEVVWESYPPVQVIANKSLLQHYTQTFSPGIFPLNTMMDVKGQMGTADPNVSMQCIGVHVFSVTHH